MRKKVLVTGGPRSGTTWTGRMLTAGTSDETLYIHEPFNRESRVAGTCVSMWPNWFEQLHSRSSEKLTHGIRKTFDCKFGFGYANKYMKEELSGAGGDGDDRVRATINRTSKAFMRADTDERVVPIVKDPIALFSAEWIYENIENTAVIVTIRNPCAFVNSFLNLGWRFDFRNLLRQPFLVRGVVGPYLEQIYDTQINRTDDPDRVQELALLWNILYDYIARLEDRYAANKSWCFVKHEDLCERPYELFREIYLTAGLKFDDSVCEAIRKSSDPSNPVDPKDHSVTDRNSKENATKWRESLSRETVDRIYELTGNVGKRWYNCSHS